MPSTGLGHEYTDTHLLTSIMHNYMPEYGGSGSVETGVRELDGQGFKNFRLIQHGWHRWREAHEFIKKGLAKGWDVYRIDRAMQFLKDRGGK